MTPEQFLQYVLDYVTGHPVKTVGPLVVKTFQNAHFITFDVVATRPDIEAFFDDIHDDPYLDGGWLYLNRVGGRGEGTQYEYHVVICGSPLEFEQFKM